MPGFHVSVELASGRVVFAHTLEEFTYGSLDGPATSVDEFCRRLKQFCVQLDKTEQVAFIYDRSHSFSFLHELQRASVVFLPKEPILLCSRTARALSFLMQSRAPPVPEFTFNAVAPCAEDARQLSFSQWQLTPNSLRQISRQLVADRVVTKDNYGPMLRKLLYGDENYGTFVMAVGKGTSERVQEAFPETELWTSSDDHGLLGGLWRLSELAPVQPQNVLHRRVSVCLDKNQIAVLEAGESLPLKKTLVAKPLGRQKIALMDDAEEVKTRQTSQNMKVEVEVGVDLSLQCSFQYDWGSAAAAQPSSSRLSVASTSSAGDTSRQLSPIMCPLKTSTPVSKTPAGEQGDVFVRPRTPPRRCKPTATEFCVIQLAAGRCCFDKCDPVEIQPFPCADNRPASANVTLRQAAAASPLNSGGYPRYQADARPVFIYSAAHTSSQLRELTDNCTFLNRIVKYFDGTPTFLPEPTASCLALLMTTESRPTTASVFTLWPEEGGVRVTSWSICDHRLRRSTTRVVDGMQSAVDVVRQGPATNESMLILVDDSLEADPMRHAFPTATVQSGKSEPLLGGLWQSREACTRHIKPVHFSLRRLEIRVDNRSAVLIERGTELPTRQIFNTGDDVRRIEFLEDGKRLFDVPVRSCRRVSVAVAENGVRQFFCIDPRVRHNSASTHNLRSIYGSRRSLASSRNSASSSASCSLIAPTTAPDL